ncbi:histidinol-phosphate transaminase [Fictibacillus aquaticus]|uniref:Histidinol-phosphate aminotransferase n=1 Tax=Fictibacillus aquaticus TaxID=2021314 RepID=A0A235FC63_9BACL|nr:histidinol-phosphate transaminase [Fictibacillus aquaticus]OYD58533.1 histidinol-phosphate transaminase [Fictibacillus aquaticus]
MQPKTQLTTLKPYQPGKPIEEVKKEFGLSKIVKLASNENPYGCSPKAKKAIEEELQNLHLYPDGYAAGIREKVAAHCKVAKEQIIFGNGSDEVVQILCRAYLGEGTSTVMPAPTFPQYRHNAVIEAAEVREVPLVEGDHDLQAMLEAIDSSTKIVWLCNPNNPTGTYINSEDFASFMEKVPKGVLVVSDEAYYEYVGAEDYPDTVPFLKQYENLIILRTFSKAYGLASLRIGYGLGAEKVIKAIEPAREPFNTSRIAQAAALAALGDQSFIEDCRQKNNFGLQQYYDFCKEQGLSYYPSEANFILVDIKGDSDEVFQYLLSRGYIVRSGSALGFPGFIRITVGNSEENSEIISLLKTFLQERIS